MAHIDITDKIGFALLKKGIIDYETLEKSLKVKESEEKKNRRNLGQILVNDFNADHDAVFREVADLYAFREIYLSDETLDKPKLDFIKKYDCAFLPKPVQYRIDNFPKIVFININFRSIFL